MNSKNRTPIIVVAVVVLIAGLAGLALLLSGGDESSGGVVAPSSTDENGDVIGPPPLENTQPVEVVGAPLPSYDAQSVDPSIGTAAPVVSGQSFDGDPVILGGATGRPAMLVFLAHWCPHCNNEIPELIALEEALGIPVGVDVIGISTGVQEGQENYPPSEWIDDKGWPWPILADDAESTAFLSYGGSGFPYTVLLDAEGNVLSRVSGSRSGADISAWLDQFVG